MLILDTNVLSELMRKAPNPSVCEWIATIPETAVFTTTLTQAEILYGIKILDDGKRKNQLLHAADAMFEEDFSGKLLSFDTQAAHAFANICSTRKKLGRPISQIDAQIAAITLSRKASLVTRNVNDFQNCEIPIINPFE